MQERKLYIRAQSSPIQNYNGELFYISFIVIDRNARRASLET